MFWGTLQHNFTRSRIHGENVGYHDDIILPALNNNATDRHDGTRSSHFIFRFSMLLEFYHGW